MKKAKISKIYSDRYTNLLSEVSEALKMGEITEEQAQLILGIVIKKKINGFIRNFIEDFVLSEETPKRNTLMYIDYSRKFLQHGK